MKTYFIFGLARSGLATALFLRSKNYPVWVYDDDPLKRQQALSLNLECKLPSSPEEWANIEALVLSPGIPCKFPNPHPIVTQALENGIEPICDIQLFFDLFPHSQAIGITGSNGKSTTCMLISHLLQKHNQPHLVVGNIGIPIFSIDCLLFLEKNPNGLLVLELSSYQLELIHHLPLKVAALLNVCEHHLHRYPSIKDYIAAKIRIFKHAEKGVIGPNPMVGILSSIKSKRNIHTLPAPVLIPDAPLKHRHDQENFAVCQAMLKALGINVTIEECQGFRHLPHRQEIVATCPKHMITFVNDSKATNPTAAARALDSFSPKNRNGAKLLWIAGGSVEEDQLNVYNPFLSSVEYAFLIGSSAVRYARHIASQSNSLEFQICDTLQQAFYSATEYAKLCCKTSTVLLSPGCSSFDQFINFEQRGEHFFSLVMSFIAQEKTHDFRI